MTVAGGAADYCMTVTASRLRTGRGFVVCLLFVFGWFSRSRSWGKIFFKDHYIFGFFQN